METDATRLQTSQRQRGIHGGGNPFQTGPLVDELNRFLLMGDFFLPTMLSPILRRQTNIESYQREGIDQLQEPRVIDDAPVDHFAEIRMKPSCRSNCNRIGGFLDCL